MYPGGEPTSRDTECFSIYSDMSTWIIASSSPNRNSASVRASSVLPTPDGPRKMNEPVGRFGSLMPARARRIERETASIASSWPMTRLCSSSSMRGRRAHRSDAHARPGLVDQVDGLVGQVPVLDVAVGQRSGGVQCVVRDLAAVMRLVAVAQAAQDLHRVVDRRLVDADLLEAPLQCRVALEVLAVFVERRRADRLQLAARKSGLEDRGCVDRALGCAGANEIVELVDEQDDVAALGDLLHHLLEALLELAAVLRTGDERSEVERVDLLVLQQLGNLIGGDARREPLDDSGLTDAGLADQHGIVLRAARQDLHHALDLRLAADDRIQLALGGLLGQVAPELVKELGALRLLAGSRGATLLAAAGAGEHPDDLVANLVRIRVEVEQDACRDALVLTHEAEQDVLGADVVVSQREGLPRCQIAHLLGTRRERDLAG